MISEIEFQKEFLEDRNLATIYFGGGTPSTLAPTLLVNLVESIHKNFDIQADCEITLEANPDDMNATSLNIWKGLGFNRLSVGVQSFNNEELKFLNRAHTAEEALKALETAHSTGFQDFNIDLIYGISEKHWKKNLEILLDLSPNHLSAYCLTIEDKTTFGNWLKKGIIEPLNEELALNQFHELLEFSENVGFEQYEISNFARNGNYSKHNTSYWLGKSYLGIGPSAHSYKDYQRFWNIANNAMYMNHIETGKIPFKQEILTLEDRVNEAVMLALRTKWGLSLDKILPLFPDFLAKNESVILKHIQNDELILKNNRLILSNKGKFLADGIAASLFV